MILINKFGKLFVKGQFVDIPVITSIKREFEIKGDIVLYKCKLAKNRKNATWEKYAVNKCEDCTHYFTSKFRRQQTVCRSCKMQKTRHVIGSIEFRRSAKVVDRVNSDRDFSNLVNLILTSNFKMSDLKSAYSYTERVNRAYNTNKNER